MMNIIKRLAMALISFVVGIIVISLPSSAFADISWPSASAGTNAIVEALLSQANSGVLQLDLVREDGSGYAQSNLYYEAWTIPIGSTKSEIQTVFDSKLSNALAKINLNDRALTGRWFRTSYGGSHKEVVYGGTYPFSVELVLDSYYEFQLEEVNGSLRVPPTACSVDLVGSTMRLFEAIQEVTTTSSAKVTRLEVSVVPAEQVHPLATVPSVSKPTIRLTIFGQAGTSVRLEGTPTFCDIQTSRWEPMATIVLDSDGKGVYDVNTSTSGNRFFRAGVE